LTAIEDNIFYRCLSGPHPGELTAQNVSLYFISPFAIWCERFAPETEKDQPSPYRELLMERGIEHERRTIQNHYPGAEPITYGPPQQGFSILLREMARGADAIFGLPVFYLPENLQGQVDGLIKREDHPSLFGQYHYEVLEIKLAKNIRRAHLLQAAMYNYIVGKIQGYTPRVFLTMNRDEEISEHPFEEHRETLALAIKGTQAILDGKEKPTATYNGCTWPWTSYTNRLAIKRRDVSLISQVGLRTKDMLVAHGYEKVKDVASARPEDLSTALGIRPGKAWRLILSAKAIDEGEPIPSNLSVLDFPKRRTEIFLDLEGTDQPAQQDELAHIDYLIGILTRNKDKETYKAFMAHRFQAEGRMFGEFMAFIRQQKDYVIYHWHNYERWHIRRLGERHGLLRNVETLLSPHMIDLHNMATRAFVFPTYRNGLKDIASFLGFQWRHKDVNALDAVAYYLNYQENPKAYRDKMQSVVDYNEDDCVATRVIRDWLERARSAYRAPQDDGAAKRSTNETLKDTRRRSSLEVC
jgi:predicted RecB family nuclease